MAKRVYRGFTALNDRRCALIGKKYGHGGLTKDEERELEMLQVVVGAMVEYRFPQKPMLDRLRRKTARLERLVARANRRG